MLRNRHNINKVLSTLTGSILILSSLFPGSFLGVGRALASNVTYTFTTPSDYNTDTHSTIHNGTAHPLVTWSDRTATDLSSLLTMKDIQSTGSPGRVWVAGDDGEMWFSNDYGVTWAAGGGGGGGMGAGIGGGFAAYEYGSITADASTNLVVVGQTAGAPAMSYSTDYGDSWNITSIVGSAGTKFTGVTYNSSTNTIWTMSDTGRVYRSTDGGHNMILMGAYGMTATYDLVWAGNNTLLMGGSGGATAAAYSTDSGTTWNPVNLPGTSPSPISAVGYANGYVYVTGVNYVAVALATSNLSLAGSWTEVTSRITNQIFTGAFEFLNINGVMFVSLKTVAGDQIYSTIDDGTTWLGHGRINNGGISAMTRLTSHGGILAAITSDVYIGSYYDSNTAVVPTANLTVSGHITSLIAAFHGKSENLNIGIAFGSSSLVAGTWYYYTGAAWSSYVGDDYTKANTPAALTDTILNGMPLTGNIFIKIYLHDPAGGTSKLTILDALTVNYTSGGAGGAGGDPPPGGSGGDTKPPSSQVDALPEFTNRMAFPITATSLDPDTKVVYLYVSTDGTHFTAWPSDQNPLGATVRPYTWAFTTDTEAKYYFYSRAQDITGNFEAPPLEGYDTSTTIDVTPPYIASAIPAVEAVDIARDQSVIVNFSEPINPASLSYSLRKTVGGAEVQTNPPVWSNDNQTVTVSYPGLLEYLTSYTFQVKTAQDRAGNDIVDSLGTPPPLHPLSWSFTTVHPQDPDLTRSHITVEKTHYGVSENPKFTVEITNDSVSTGQGVAKIDFVPGISYKEGSAQILQGGGQLTTEMDADGKTRLVWRGDVAYQAVVIFEFQANIAHPTDFTDITQGVKIFDNVHYFEDDSPYLPTPANFSIDKSPKFTTSTKEVDKTDAQPGDDLTYTIVLANTGDTGGDMEFSDPIPTYTSFVAGSITQTGNWTTLGYDQMSNRIHGTAHLGVGEEVSVSFRVQINGALAPDRDTYISNSATVQDADVPSSFYTLNLVTTLIPGQSKPDEEVPEIIYQSPAMDETGVKPRPQIVIGFNKTMEPSSLRYRITLGDGSPVSTLGWEEQWSNFNSSPNAEVTITPNTDLELGEDYTVEVTEAEDTFGNVLGACSQEDVSSCSPNPWTFTIAAPALRIIARPIDADIVNLPIGQIDEEFVVQIYDEITGLSYIPDSDTTIRLLSTSDSGKFVRHDGTYLYNPANGKWETRVVAGQSQTSFYYIDSQPTPADEWDTLTAYVYPPQGWSAGIKRVVVGKTDTTRGHLTIHPGSETTEVGAFTAPIEIKAYDGTQRRVNLPEGHLFFQSSGNGTFYDDKFQPLPQWITAQGVRIAGGATLQYMNMDSNTFQGTVYYRSNQSGLQLLTVGDNAPLNPDTGMENASAVIQVGVMELDKEKKPEEELVKDLEEIDDQTGREIAKMVIKPSETQLFPGDGQAFSIKAYDQDNKEVKGLKFKWFVIAGGGTIEKEGIEGDSTVTIFTAGAKPGRYFNTVLVATLYNGQLAYVTADVDVVDVAQVGGRLPVTGLNGLQAIFMGLTLLSAVALAWVEHYEKTHFDTN